MRSRADGKDEQQQDRPETATEAVEKREAEDLDGASFNHSGYAENSPPIPMGRRRAKDFDVGC
jgi:hypothetical protein